eukprot:10272992-Alexandrium_andersonii.AAC.1
MDATSGHASIASLGVAGSPTEDALSALSRPSLHQGTFGVAFKRLVKPPNWPAVRCLVAWGGA